MEHDHGGPERMQPPIAGVLVEAHDVVLQPASKFNRSPVLLLDVLVHVLVLIVPEEKPLLAVVDIIPADHALQGLLKLVIGHVVRPAGSRHGPPPIVGIEEVVGRPHAGIFPFRDDAEAASAQLPMEPGRVRAGLVGADRRHAGGLERPDQTRHRFRILVIDAGAPGHHRLQPPIHQAGDVVAGRQGLAMRIGVPEHCVVDHLHAEGVRCRPERDEVGRGAVGRRKGRRRVRRQVRQRGQEQGAWAEHDGAIAVLISQAAEVRRQPLDGARKSLRRQVAR